MGEKKEKNFFSCLNFKRVVEIGIIAILGGGCASPPPPPPPNILTFSAPNTKIGNLEELCRGGDGEKCRKVGEIYRWGRGVSPNPQLAKKFWGIGCKMGDGLSCVWKGRGEKNSTFWKEMAEEGCQRGSGLGCVMAGLMEIDQNRSGEFFKKGCQNGEVVGCWLENRKGESGEEKKGETSFFNWKKTLKDGKKGWKRGVISLQKGCNRGEEKSCVTLGTLSFLGVGVEWEPQKGVKLYRKSCLKLKSGDGCYLLGRLYLRGIWVEKDYWQVLKFFRKACKLGSPWGCKELP